MMTPLWQFSKQTGTSTEVIVAFGDYKFRAVIQNKAMPDFINTILEDSKLLE